MNDEPPGVVSHSLAVPVLTPDGSLVDASGRVLHFSIRRFVLDVAEGAACFACGKARSDGNFNDEHVIPDWVLRRAGIHDERITLPNGVLRKYSGHRLPCCEECNSLLGNRLEEPVSKMLAAGLEGVRNSWTEEKTKLLFTWMALLFVKLQLVDSQLRWHLDRRLGTDPVSSPYDWAALHHAHCVARRVVVDTALDDGAVGTVFIHPAAAVWGTRFDLADLHFAKTILVQVDGLLIYAVINDAGIVQHHLRSSLKRLGALTRWQAREVFSRLAYCNFRIDQRPVFQTVAEDDSLSIVCISPDEYRLRPLDPTVLGSIMRQSLGSLASTLSAEDQSGLDRGELTFLFRPDGSFCAHGDDGAAAR